MNPILLYGFLFIVIVEGMKSSSKYSASQSFPQAGAVKKPVINRQGKVLPPPPMVRFQSVKKVLPNDDGCVCSGSVVLKNVMLTTRQCGDKIQERKINGGVYAVSPTGEEPRVVEGAEPITGAEVFSLVKLFQNTDKEPFEWPNQDIQPNSGLFEGQWVKDDDKWIAIGHEYGSNKSHAALWPCNAGAPVYTTTGQVAFLHGVAPSADSDEYLPIHKLAQWIRNKAEELAGPN